jgi:hypothetical protein
MCILRVQIHLHVQIPDPRVKNTQPLQVTQFAYVR